MSQNLFSSSFRGVPRAGVCSVCGSSLGFFCCCLYYYFLDYLVLYVCVYGVRGGKHDKELIGEKIFCWAGSIE